MAPKQQSSFFFPGEPVAEGDMRLTLLGTGTPFPRRGQAGASLLVEAGSKHKLLIDCGPGAPQNFTSLQIPFPLVEKVFCTHHPMDHIGGFGHFWIGGWTYGRRKPLRVWGPPGTKDICAHYEKIYAWDIETRRRVFETLDGSQLDVTEYDEGPFFAEDGLSIRAIKVIHTPPQNTYAMRLEYGNRVFVFSADTKRCEALIDHAQGADLFIHEAFRKKPAGRWSWQASSRSRCTHRRARPVACSRRPIRSWASSTTCTITRMCSDRPISRSASSIRVASRSATT